MLIISFILGEYSSARVADALKRIFRGISYCGRISLFQTHCAAMA